MIPETAPEQTDDGLVARGDGWFVLNAQDARWRDRAGRGKSLPFAGPVQFPHLDVVLYVLGPGEPIGMYHWETIQEDFLVVAGEGLLLVEGQERALRQWDFVHCPPHAQHMIVGAGNAPCVVVAVGAHQEGDGPWGGYTVDEVALRHGAGVERETNDAEEAYARFPDVRPERYGGWLPGASDEPSGSE